MSPRHRTCTYTTTPALSLFIHRNSFKSTGWPKEKVWPPTDPNHEPLGGQVARGRSTHRLNLYDESGRRMVAVGRAEGERIRLDREERMSRAMQDADSMAIGGPLRMSEMMAIAGLYGKRRRYHDREKYMIAGMIGNFADHAAEKFAQYADVHDRRAVTVRADRTIWIPDPTQAAKRAKRYAEAAKN